MRASTILATVCAAFSTVAHPSQSNHPAKTFAKCQKIGKRHPLDGCPKNTIYVSKDDASASYTSIQEAILSLPNESDAYTILIAPGDYTEQLNVTRPGPLTLLGATNSPSRGELYADIDYDTPHSNQVTVWFNLANNDRTVLGDNVYTGVLTVGPTLNATFTGAGPTGWPIPEGTPFGSTDFRAYNMDFRNDYSDFADGPAHALGVSRANAGFYSCGLYSYQDTLYVGKLGNAYFYDTIIAGQVDFLYGFGTAFIDKSTLSLRNYGGGITAWKGTNTTFENKYGVYIADSRILAANSTIAETIKGQVPLGRPWNLQHRSIFMNTYFDPSILPAGYIGWSTNFNPNYTFMASFDNYGPGYDLDALNGNNLTIVLDKKGVRPYARPVDVFLTEDGKPRNIGWIDKSVLSGH